MKSVTSGIASSERFIGQLRKGPVQNPAQGSQLCAQGFEDLRGWRHHTTFGEPCNFKITSKSGPSPACPSTP